MTSSFSLVKREVSFCGRQVSVLSDGCDGPKQFLTQLAETRSLQLKYGSFFVADIGRIVRRYRDQWSTLLPGIRPFYAVKANNDPVVVGVLARLGAGFDCASKKEIEQVLAVIEPSEAADRIIFANPFKKPSHIRYAAENGVNLMTFDCESELRKIKAGHPNAKPVIRIKPSDCTKAEEKNNINKKFGIDASRAAGLLAVAAQLGLNVVGVSFHVGNRCYDSSVYGDTIRAAAELFDIAAERFGFHFDLLDIGGGFYGDTNPAVAFDGIAGAISSAVDEHFGHGSTAAVRVIAEPGSFFAMPVFRLAACVIAIGHFVGEDDDDAETAKSSSSASTGLAAATTGTVSAAFSSATPSSSSGGNGYILSDGMFGSLAYTTQWMRLKPVPILCASGVGDDCAVVSARQLQQHQQAMFETTLWGPTCSGRDCIVDRYPLPQLVVGDWVTFDDVGAYTIVKSTDFNGMPKAKRFYVIEERCAKNLFDDC